MDAENVESTTYSPVYYIVDHSLLGETLAADVQALLSDEETNLDFMVVKREDIDSGKDKGKKPPAKKKGEAVEEEEEDDNSHVSLNEGMLAAFKEVVQKEVARRQDLLYASRRAIIEEATGGAKGKGKAPKKSGKKGEKKEEEKEPEKPNNLPTSYPASLPLHIRLDGIIKKVGDCEQLLEIDVLLNAIVSYQKGQGQNDAKDPEFQYGNPLENKTEGEAKTEAPEEPAAGEEQKAEEPSLFKQIVALSTENEALKDLGSVAVSLSKTVLDAIAKAESCAESRPTTAGKAAKGKKSAKGKKDAPEASEEESGAATEVTISTALAIRQTSNDLTDFHAWKADARLQEIKTTDALDGADLRLYHSLMKRVPEACMSVPLLLHCAFQQVGANVADTDLQPMFTNEKIDTLESYLDDALSMIMATKMAEDEPEEPPAPDVWAEWKDGGEEEEEEEEAYDNEVEVTMSQQPPPLDFSRTTNGADSRMGESRMTLSDVCDGTMGGPCEFTNDVCVNCGRSQSPRNASAAGVRPSSDEFRSESVPMAEEFGSYCPATMGDACSYINNRCQFCDMPKPDGFGFAGTGEVGGGGGGGGYSVNVDVEELPIDGSLEDFVGEGQMMEFEDEIAPAPKAKKPKNTNRPLSTTVLKYGDERRINQAFACLEAGKSWEEFPLTDDVDEISGFIHRPGVKRAGMPDSSAISVAERGITRTEMLNKSALPAEVFERGLLTLTLEEMLDFPAPSVDFCLTKHTEFFVVDHLYRESKHAEQKVDLKIQEIRAAAMLEGATKALVGQEDEIVEQARIKWDWELGSREYREEIDASILPQVIANAVDVTDSVHTQARYEPLDDSLYIVCHARTPLLRRRTVAWESFLCPQMNFSTWAQCPVEVKKMQPEVLFGFNNGHTGKLKHEAQIMYPRDGGCAGLTKTTSGAKQINTVWVQKDSELMYMRGDPEAGENMLNVTFKDKSFMSFGCKKDEEGFLEPRPTFSITTTSGLLITISPDGKVYMSNPAEVASFKRTRTGRGGEEWRCMNSNGVVIKKMLDSESTILLPDANVSTYDAQSDSWTTTNNAGKRVRTSTEGTEGEVVADVEVAEQVDPESGATVTTREDLAMMIRYRDGSTLSQHSDGTRIYTDKFPRGDKKRHLVECPGFPPVSFDVEKKVSLGGVDNVVPRTGGTGRNLRSLERKTGKVEKRGGLQEVWESNIQINLWDGTVIKKRGPQGGLVVSRDGARFVCCPNGKFIYVPKTLAPELFPNSLNNCEYEEHAIPRESYTFDIIDGTLNCHDLEDNTFMANLAGQCETKLSREQGAGASANNSLAPKFFPPPENAIPPRIFVVRGDGSGCELLAPQRVKDYLDSVSRSSRCRQLPAEPLAGSPAGDSFTAMEIDGHAPEIKEALSFKFLETLPAPVAYTRKPVIPNIVKAAPNVFTADDKPRHNFIVYRHLIRQPRLTEEQRKQVIAEKKAYQDWKLEQEENDLAFLTDDPRSAEEIEEEKRLQIEVMTARARRKEKSLSATLTGHDSLASTSAKDTATRPSTMDRVNLGSTLPSMYDPPKNNPVTTVPLSQVGSDGTREPIKFFNGKRKSRKGAAKGKSTRAASTTRIPAKVKKSVELGPYFKNPIMGQRFNIKELLAELKLQCHPMHREGIVQGELLDAVADLPAGEAEVKENEHFYKLASVVKGIRDIIGCVGRIFSRPHDPTLRTIDLASSVYAPILEGSDIITRFVKPILQTLGFEENTGILVLMQDDLFVKDGIKSLNAHLQQLLSRAIAEPDPEKVAALARDDSDEEEEGAQEYEVAEPPVQRSRAYNEREARMKATLNSPTVHNRQTFKYDNFNSRDVQPKPSLDEYGMSTGTLNMKYINRETAAKRPTKTISTQGRVGTDPTASFTDFQFVPDSVWFGELKQGCTYRMTCSLTNVGVEPGKFRLVVPQTDANQNVIMQSHFRPGSLAAGMHKQVDLEVYARQCGDFHVEVTVATEKATFTVPVTGSVVPAAATGETETGSGRAATKSPHHLPPLRRGRFGKIGKVRKHSEGASDKSAQLLRQLDTKAAAARTVVEPAIPPVNDDVEIDPSRTLGEIIDKSEGDDRL